MKSVEWGEYRIEDLFDSSNGDTDIQKKHINNKGYLVITSGVSNNGILGKTDVNAKIFDSGTITVDMFGLAFYRNFYYKMVTHARVFSLKPHFNLNDRQGLFLVSSLSFLKHKFDYDNMCTWNKIKEIQIKLPRQNGTINLDFMDSFIAELEAERLAKLSAYLKLKGSDNYKLSIKKFDTLEKLYSVEWGEYKLGDIFEKLSVKKAKKQKVRKYKNSEFNTPVVYCKFGDNGIMYWGRKNEFTTYENVISVIYNGAIAAGKVYAQREKTGILAESYFIRLKKHKSTHNINLFLASVIEKTLYYKYSREYLATWDGRVENDTIYLPTKEGEINFDFMDSFIAELEAEQLTKLSAYLKSKGLDNYDTDSQTLR